MPGDCRTCGACCFSDSTSYIDVTERDHERLGEWSTELTDMVEGHRYMRMEDGHCIALEVVGQWLVCSIYDDRPAACHELERGSPPCLAEMTLKKARALRALER